eukprot:CAMPEP_0196573118 /NCGR_PEP_ID=MMETSP1081-20130531/3066_1 /TAXON_ID=36882 /ORGANISM="Pyramimonas amylifera, Strain CCMP720" /LENGTH=393 /DNA_ID=CAMNT_0041890709 /DNA_START=98 /DNA_END=1275 /DNA_ORIENTATION=-
MRKYDKNIHNKLNDKLKTRAEKFAENNLIPKDPRQLLRVSGVRVRMHHDINQHAAIEAKEGLIPWNGNSDNLIDRFDGRALLDFYREPVNRSNRELAEEEEELNEKLRFESYRDLIRLLKRKIPESQALAETENREILLHANEEYERNLTSADKNKNGEKNKPRSDGAFAAVGFSYDGRKRDIPAQGAEIAGGWDSAGNDSSDDGSDDSDSEADEVSDSSDSEAARGVELDEIAALFDVSSFRRQLRRARREKQLEQRAGAGFMSQKPPNPAGSRRSRRNKLRNLRSQGVSVQDAYIAFAKPNPKSQAPLANPPTPSYRRRSSPTYEKFGPRNRSSSPRRSQEESTLPARREYISSFNSTADAPDSGDDERRERRGRREDEGRRGGGGRAVEG